MDPPERRGYSRVLSGAKKLEWLAGGGAMGELIAALDWSATALGSIESWPQSLRTTVSLCLASNFPINIIWGDEHSQIYNDGYRVICGAVHPRALGEDYRVTWASAWPAIGEPFERALRGETTYLENQRMFLERNGYQEETFFTFSLSPIRGESGKVMGLFHPVTETTKTILAERRTRLLRDIADNTGRATAFDEACQLLLGTFEGHAFDIPFALLYACADDGKSARLRGVRGISAGTAFAVEHVSIEADAMSSTWPLAEAAQGGRTLRVADVEARFGRVAAGTYPEAIATAFVMPVRLAGSVVPLGFLVTGASPRLPIDDAYEGFMEMVGAATSAALGNARASELERERAEALAELDRAKIAFFSNVSHEFRTPLTLMLGPLQDLLEGRDGEVDGAAHAQLQVVQRNALRLLKLVNALLDFARIEAGRAQAAFRPTDLAMVTRETASAFHSAVVKVGMRFVVDVEPVGKAVPVDRDMWEKIVLNLVSNAFKFTHEGEIRVTLRAVGDSAELAVHDTGIGIPHAELARVFDRFHRIEGATGRTHEGTGIGLALVKDLAQLHGGTAEVTSTVGKGSTFTVRIPLERAGEVVADAALDGPSSVVVGGYVAEAERWIPDAAAEDVATPTSEVTDRPHIIVADDNADMREYIRRLLAGRYHVTLVVNGADALRQAERARPDLLLSDVMMPVMDGAQLVRELRAHPTLRTVPIILLSARAGEDETTSGLALGADDYLTKPFSAKELLARVHSQLTMAALRMRVTEEEMRAKALSERQRELKALLDARDEFLAVASHELKTPITSLGMQLQMTADAIEAAGDQPVPAERLARLVRVSTAQLTRLTSLVDDLLDVARIRSGRLAIELADVDLAALVRETVARMAAPLAQAGCSLDLHAPVSLHGQWDARRLEQVLTNLLSNVIRYASGKPVHVTLTGHPGRATLEVRDFGPGVPEDLRATVFERFDRGKASRNAGGLGLGLFITRQLVAAHGGSIGVESATGGGACFTVELPRTSAA
jgi:signal transduction histidine kinase